MIDIKDLSWLAGVFDGEGCVQLLWHKKLTTKPPSVSLVVGNTSKSLIDKIIRCYEALEVPFSRSEQKLDSRRMIKTQVYIRVARKVEVLKVTELLIPHSTAKQPELVLARWYLRRSCQNSLHKITEQEIEVLKSISSLKRGEPVSPLAAFILSEPLDLQSPPTRAT